MHRTMRIVNEWRPKKKKRLEVELVNIGELCALLRSCIVHSDSGVHCLHHLLSLSFGRVVCKLHNLCRLRRSLNHCRCTLSCCAISINSTFQPKKCNELRTERTRSQVKSKCNVVIVRCRYTANEICRRRRHYRRRTHSSSHERTEEEL